MKKPKVYNLKTFFSQKELKALKIKTRRTKYLNFIKEVHRRMLIEMILESEEGFIMPYRLGQISVKKTKRVSGIMPRYLSNEKCEDTIEYNSHTFGDVYNLNWNKECFSGMDLSFKKQHYFPTYKGRKILYLRSFNFRPVQAVRDIMKEKITNKNL